MSSDTSIRNLVNACLGEPCPGERSEAAWREILERFGPRIEAGARRGLYRAGGCYTQEDLEETTQEIYCRLLERGGRRLRLWRGRTESELGGYLLRLAERTAADRRRSERAKKRGAAELQRSREVGWAGALDSLPDHGHGPEEQALLAEAWRRKVRRYQRRFRGSTAGRNLRIFFLATVEDWTSREISQEIAGPLSESGVDSVVWRTRQRLAGC